MNNLHKKVQKSMAIKLIRKYLNKKILIIYLKTQKKQNKFKNKESSQKIIYKAKFNKLKKIQNKIKKINYLTNNNKDYKKRRKIFTNIKNFGNKILKKTNKL